MVVAPPTGWHTACREATISNDLASALEPVADKHRLGALVSLHRQERALIRFRAQMAWILVAGLLAGALFVAVQSFAAFVGVVVVYVAGIAFAGPLAAWAFPPDGPARWVALFEHGLIDIVQHDVDRHGREPENDLVVRSVRFEQIQKVEQHREYNYSTGTEIRAGSAVARVVADRDGRQTVLDFASYRHQDRFLDAIRARITERLNTAAVASFRRTGQARFGNLTATAEGLSVNDGTGLLPGGPACLPWPDLARVAKEGLGASLIIYRRPRPGERGRMRDGSIMWYAGAVPNAFTAAAVIAAAQAPTQP